MGRLSRSGAVLIVACEVLSLAPTSVSRVGGNLLAVSCTYRTPCTAVGEKGDNQPNNSKSQAAGVTPPRSTLLPVGTSTTASSPNHGYWLVSSDGGIFTFGSAQFYGSAGDIGLQRPVVGIGGCGRSHRTVGSDSTHIPGPDFGLSLRRPAPGVTVSGSR